MLTTKTAQSLDVNGPEKYFVNNQCVELCFTPEQVRGSTGHFGIWPSKLKLKIAYNIQI
jgi:hypothetical protein